MKKCFFYLVAFGLLAVLSGCMSPLYTASERGDIETVKKLLDQGADVNPGKGQPAQTPLHAAAGAGHIDIVRILIEKGANVNIKSYYWGSGTPLNWAAENGHTDIAQLLIEKGAHVNATNDGGMTPLASAAYGGQTDTAQFLINKGAHIDSAIAALENNAIVYASSTRAVKFRRGAELLEGLKPNQQASASSAINSREPLNVCADYSRLYYKDAEAINFTHHGKYNVKSVSSIREARDNDCDVIARVIEQGLGGPGTVEVTSTYSKELLFKSTALQRPFGDPRFYVLADQVFAAFAPGTQRYKKVVAEREAFLSSQQQPQGGGISKEELKSIVQAAIEGSAQAQKTEARPAPVRTDIASPSFGPSERVMTENDLAVIIGIEGYQSLPKSDYSYDDAMLVKEYAKALGFKERNIELLGDERATKSGIEKTIEAWLVNKSKPGSRVFVYYSGHGAPDPATGDAYLVPYDGDPNYLAQTGYPLKRLYASLGKLPSSEVVVVLDACFSGAGGRSVIAKGARPMMVTGEKLTTARNMVVITSTQGAQISTSSPEKGHGVFTYYFLKALKDGKKNAGEIYEYVKPLVEDEAKQMNVQQSPSITPDVSAAKGRFTLRR